MSADSKSNVHLEIGHVLFMDVVGYSKLLIDDQRALQEQLSEIVRNTEQFRAAEAAGKLVRVPAGDGMALVFFNSPEAPLQCAIKISQALKNYPRLQLRMGIHSGPINELKDVNDQTNVAGSGINIAQRVMDCGDAGHILLSKRLAEDLAQSRQWERHLHDLGECAVKHGVGLSVVNFYTDEIGNPALPERIRQAQEERGAANAATGRRIVGITVGLAVLAAGLFVFRMVGTDRRAVRSDEANDGRLSATSLPGKSIAVLPFVNMSENVENEYFSDGITEEILNALARTPGLRVAARTSAFFFKGKNEPVEKIGDALKVGVVLEGSVRRAGDQLRITAQLINVADGYHLWSDTFDRKAEDVFAIQSEVAQRVLEALKVKLLPESGPTVARGGTDSLEAYDLFLRGRQLWNKRTGPDITRAIGYFQQATEKDPKFALAYAGLGSCYAVLPGYTDVAAQEAVPQARAAARRALELDSRLAEAHAVLGQCLIFENDFAGAEKAITEALALNPNYATAHHWYSSLLPYSGRLEQGLAEARQAQALDPLSAVIQTNVGTLLFLNRRYEEALAQVDTALRLAPDFPSAYRVRSWVKIAQKKFPEAIADVEKGRALASDDPEWPGLLGYCYAAVGRANDAQQQIERLKANAAKGITVATTIALVYQGLGDKEQVFAWLERAASDPYDGVLLLKYTPIWDEVTADPRYAALLKKHGLDK